MNHSVLKIVVLVLTLSRGLVAFGSETSSSTNVLPEPEPKPSFTAKDADSVFAAYNKAFYVVENGKGYYKEETTGGRNHFWTQAEEIEMILDVWDRSHSPAAKSVLEQSMNGFVDHFGSNWMSNAYNDDLIWMVIASARAYLVTTNAEYKHLAKLHFDLTYARSWSTNLGGGLWWNTTNHSKNACVNGPAAIAACYLFQIVGEHSYLEKAKAIYAWEKLNLFDQDSGAVHDNRRADGRISGQEFTYNEGTFIGAANFLCKLTGDKSYLGDAEKAADFTRDELCVAGTLPGYGGGDAAGFNGIFVRWLARLATDNHRWPKYHGWMVQNANAAWNGRRADGLAWNRWQTMTPNRPLRAWGCADTVVIMQVVPLDLP